MKLASNSEIPCLQDKVEYLRNQINILDLEKDEVQDRYTNFDLSYLKTCQNISAHVTDRVDTHAQNI